MLQCQVEQRREEGETPLTVAVDEGEVLGKDCGRAAQQSFAQVQHRIMLDAGVALQQQGQGEACQQDRDGIEGPR